MALTAAQMLANAIASEHLSDGEKAILRGATQALETARKVGFAEPQVRLARDVISNALEAASWSAKIGKALAKASAEVEEGGPLSVRSRRPPPRQPAGFEAPKSPKNPKEKDSEAKATHLQFQQQMRERKFVRPGISEKGRAPPARRPGEGPLLCESCKQKTCIPGERRCRACQD